jgi:acyl-CoA thioester hydrolase
MERSPACEMVLQIRWGDMDAAGHVNNTNYFRYMEQVRIAWFERVGHMGDMGQGEGPVIVNASATFLKQLHYPGKVLIRMTTGNPGRSSFDTSYELFHTNAPDIVCATGEARCVWMDYRIGKSAPMPESLRQEILAPRLYRLD